MTNTDEMVKLADIERELRERVRGCMNILRDIREEFDCEFDRGGPGLSDCDDMETALHNIGAVVSHLTALRTSKENPA